MGCVSSGTESDIVMTSFTFTEEHCVVTEPVLAARAGPGRAERILCGLGVTGGQGRVESTPEPVPARVSDVKCQRCPHQC